tara:strand:+ start:18004 stop:18156 length:153 start_codon:yes stop_codon:yes gene_type:complete
MKEYIDDPNKCIAQSKYEMEKARESGDHRLAEARRQEALYKLRKLRESIK